MLFYILCILLMFGIQVPASEICTVTPEITVGGCQQLLDRDPNTCGDGIHYFKKARECMTHSSVLMYARDYLLLAARLDFAQAQFDLSIWYLFGIGKDAPNAQMGKSWYMQASLNGYSGTYLIMNTFLTRNKAARRARTALKSWAHEAASQGYAAAECDLGYYYLHAADDHNPELGVQFLRRSVEKDYHLAQCFLGLEYQKGKHVPQDDIMAYELYMQAAQSNLPMAIFCLAQCHEKGIYVPKNDILAFEHYLKAAQKGDPAAQFHVGLCCQNGIGCPSIDYGEAFKWFEMGANQFHPQACRYAALCLDRGPLKNQDRALMYYHQAAHLGDDEAKLELAHRFEFGLGIPINLGKAIGFLKKNSTHHLQTALRLGRCYEKLGPDHYIKAFCAYEKAYNLGSIDAMFAMGCCLLNGVGVEKDCRLGLSYIQNAAEAGFPGAQHNLGHYFLDGYLVPPDHETAFKWFKKAALNGEVRSIFAVGRCYLMGIGTKQNYRKANILLHKAYENGIYQAAFYIGKMHYDGVLDDSDTETALHWLKIAASKGYADAYYFLALLSAKDTTNPQHREIANAYYQKVPPQSAYYHYIPARIRAMNAQSSGVI
ncbi:MAG: tetratricopeptide repeat protein [Alphaproteobacteria bacterium]|nr:tetratricopeptide repeat protein [Alphaproteobacteria bacterium]